MSRSFTPAGATVITPIPALDLGSSSEEARIAAVAGAGRPLLLRGTSAADFSPGALRDLLGDDLLNGFESYDSEDWIQIPATRYFQEFDRGATTANIVDHELVGPRFDALCPVPPFIDRMNLLRFDAGLWSLRRSLVVTSQGTVTPFHVDSYGLGGWMALAIGEKEWELVEPRHQTTLYDSAAGRFYDPFAHQPANDLAARLDAIPRWRGTLRAGELLIWPSGFIHRVETPIASIGIGGSWVDAGSAGLAMRSWLIERRLGVEAERDFAAIYRRILACCAPDERIFIQAALSECEEWESRRTPQSGTR